MAYPALSYDYTSTIFNYSAAVEKSLLYNSSLNISWIAPDASEENIVIERHGGREMRIRLTNQTGADIPSAGVVVNISAGVLSAPTAYIDVISAATIKATGPVYTTGQWSHSIINVSSYTYQPITGFDLLGMQYTTTSSMFLQLPTASSIGTKILVVTDEAGAAATNMITISSSSGELISGVSSIILSQNYNSVSLYTNGINKWFVW